MSDKSRAKALKQLSTSISLQLTDSQVESMIRFFGLDHDPEAWVNYLASPEVNVPVCVEYAVGFVCQLPNDQIVPEVIAWRGVQAYTEGMTADQTRELMQQPVDMDEVNARLAEQFQ